MFDRSKSAKLLLPIFLLFQFSLIGCAFKKNTDDNEPGNELSVEAMSEDELKVTIEETEVFNEYYVQFALPEGKKVKIEVRDESSLIHYNRDSKSKLLIPIIAGRSEKYEVTVYNALGGVLFKKNVELESPRDLALADKEMYNLVEDEAWEYNRILFSHRAVLHLNGHNITIKANKILFGTDSEIRTLNHQTIATKPENLAGSQISIKAKKIAGRLKATLVGYHGRDGLSGDQIDKNNQFVDGYVPALKGSRGADGKATRGSPRSDALTQACVKSPTNGGPGAQGAQGVDGKNGENGGSTGSLKIESEDRSSILYVDLELIPGQPGKGGAGGLGRRGGEGGDPGSAAGDCSPASKGPEGPRGSQGSAGLDGEIGKIGDIQGTPKIPNVIFNHLDSAKR